jgi:hypothetical protein
MVNNKNYRRLRCWHCRFFSSLLVAAARNAILEITESCHSRLSRRYLVHILGSCPRLLALSSSFCPVLPLLYWVEVRFFVVCPSMTLCWAFRPFSLVVFCAVCPGLTGTGTGTVLGHLSWVVCPGLSVLDCPPCVVCPRLGVLDCLSWTVYPGLCVLDCLS